MSTYPLATIFHGDVTVEEGSDYTQFGYGDLNVHRKLIVNGLENSNGSPSVGSVLISGGVKIDQSLHVHGDLNVLYDQTRLTETHIDTTNGPTTITGGNKVDINVGTTSNFITTAGDLTMYSSAGSLKLYGGLNSISAIDISAKNSNGGITLMSGIDGGIDIGVGTGNYKQTTSNGNTIITTNNGYGNFVVNSNSNNQDLNIHLTGNTDSQIKIESSGNNTSKDAILINTTNDNGSITISNNNGLGSGYLEQMVGSGGFYVTTNTSGPIAIIAQASTSEYLIKTNTAGNNMTIGLENCTDSALLIKSSGTNATRRALEIKTTCPGGSIYLTNPTQGSVGGVNIFSASSGLNCVTSNGSTSITTYSGTTSIVNETTLNNQDINISINGETDSKINITSDAPLQDAINLTTTNSGGILIDSDSLVSIQSNDISDGIKIGTDYTIPISIGTALNTTTINGDLLVKGTTTTINTEVVTIKDNIIVVNNTPLSGSDGGMAIKRYQNANDDGSGDVVADTPEVTGNVVNGGTITTVVLDSSASSSNNIYNGWWIKLNKGSNYQVRRISSYDGATKTATIYSTSDQTFTLGNPSPIEGMNFTQVPDDTWNYSLYPCHYVLSIWDESANQFVLMCASESTNGMYEFAHYTDLRLNKLIAQEINTTYINGSLADITTTVTLDDDSTSPVTITNFPSNIKYGIYLVFVKPISITQRAHGIFMIGRANLNGTPGTVVRIISVRGINNEQLDIQWLADDWPQLFYRYKPGIIGNTEYQIKMISL